MPSATAKATIVAGGALCAETGHHTGRSAQGQAYCRRCADRKHRVVGRQSQAKQGTLRQSLGGLYRSRARARRCSRRISTAAPMRNTASKRACSPNRLALAFHPPAFDPPRTLASLRAYVPDMTIVDMPSFKAGRQAARRPRRLRHHGGDRFHPQDRADLRVFLCRRDEEVGVHHAELLSAGAGRHADALLGQCRQGRRQRAVLRSVRHRQDHAVDRPEPHPDRRRRNRLVAAGHLQFRGRLLRQMHKTLGRGRAANLGRHQPLRRRVGKRRVRSGHPHSAITTATRRPRTPARPIRSNSFRAPRAPGVAGHPKNIIFLTADAFGVMPPIAKLNAGAGDVSLPVRLYRQGRRHRKGPGRRRAGILDLLRRAVLAAAAGGIRPAAARLHRQAQCRLLAGQFRLDRRHLRHRPPHADQGRPARWSPARWTVR